MTDHPMTAATPTLTDFLLARFAEDAERARVFEAHFLLLTDSSGRPMVTTEPLPPHMTYARVLAECEAKRRIVEWHQNWPVMVETQPEFVTADADPATMSFRMTQQIAWMTEREYRARFGSEPPTSPILRLLALPYADHPEWREEWAVAL